MEAGKKAGVPFQEACGGEGMCCTCHVYLNNKIINAEDYIKPLDEEIDMVDQTDSYKDESRLAC